MRRVVMAFATLLAGFLVAGCGGSTEGLFGRDLYEQSCAACHLSDGSGQTGVAIGEGSNATTLTDAQIRGVIAVGPGAMPAFGRLTDEQLDSLVAYLRELQSE